jgi:hypothetical protein
MARSVCSRRPFSGDLPSVFEQPSIVLSIVPHRVRILLEEVGVRLLWLVAVEGSKATNESALEHAALLVHGVVDTLGEDAIFSQLAEGT